MIILGLTGSIGMGKSTAAGQLRRLGVPVHDADATVHALMAQGGAAVPLIERAFPGVVVEGAVDRQELGRRVFGQPEELRRLEAILHPLVRQAERRFLARMARRGARRGARIVALDSPLLFETGGEDRCDAVIVVTAPPFVQEQRVMARPGMTRAKFEAIRKHQMPDQEKRRRADFVVNTGRGFGEGLRQLREIVRIMERRRGRKWPIGLRT